MRWPASSGVQAEQQIVTLRELLGEIGEWVRSLVDLVEAAIAAILDMRLEVWGVLGGCLLLLIGFVGLYSFLQSRWVPWLPALTDPDAGPEQHVSSLSS